MPKFSAKITERDPMDIPKSSAISRNINRRSIVPRNLTHQFFHQRRERAAEKTVVFPRCQTTLKRWYHSNAVNRHNTSPSNAILNNCKFLW